MDPLEARVEISGPYNAADDFIERHEREGRTDRLAVIDDRVAWTYGDLVRHVRKGARLLRALGVAPEQRVALLLTDTVMFPTLFWGAIRAGIVPVPINTMLAPADHAYILRDCRARVLFVTAALLPRIAALLPSLPHLERVIVDGDGDDSLASHLAAQSDAPFPHADTHADEPCFWLYTSGSTGQPKAAVHLHRNLPATADLYGRNVLGIHPDDVVFSAAKLFFAYGLGNAMTFPFRVGAASMLMEERPTPASVSARLVGSSRARRPTVFCGVPTLFASMLAYDALPRAPDHALRVCTSAGEALPAHVGLRWRETTGVDIVDGIGSTEMLHIFLSNRIGDVRYGTTGRPVEGYTVKLLGDDGAPVPPGTMGDLWVNGPSAAAQYWNRRTLSLATFQGEWTRTGDRYVQRDDGCYVYQGRSDDMLKVGGIYVSPFEVEACLMGHASVLEAAVVGAHDESGLVKPHAFVVLRTGSAPSDALAEALRQHVKAQLAPFKYPRWIDFVEDLPKTATGKIQRFRLRGAR